MASTSKLAPLIRTTCTEITPDGEKTRGSRQLPRPRATLSPCSGQPHSLNPQTWHFTHPSAYSSCDPQSGHVPMNVSPPLYAW